MGDNPGADLDFPMIATFNNEVPIDLAWYLYSGGAKVHKRYVIERIAGGHLGYPRLERLPLLKNIHQQLAERIAKGGSKDTFKTSVTYLTYFYRFADAQGLDPTAANAKQIFVDWADHLNQRMRRKELKSRSVYESCLTVADLLSGATAIPTRTLLNTARVSRKSVRGGYRSRSAKQNITETFAFGNMLADISNGLTVDAIRGPLPIPISFRDGRIEDVLCNLRPTHTVNSLSESPRNRANAIRAVLNRARLSADHSPKIRYPAINLRVEAEALLFIAQTGMNVSQVLSTGIGDFRYESYGDGYRVRRYKARRFGDVEFEIYSEYRDHFERYLRWREAIFGGTTSALLFPSFNKYGDLSTKQSFSFEQVKNFANRLKLSFVAPQTLRKTRINWLFRRSDDPSLTAEMAQHTEQTLLRVYAEPNHQRAAIEVTKFWNENDPAIETSIPGPGGCAGSKPEAMAGRPKEAPTPDCMGSAGCLFCIHQRDIDSMDHVWSLASYRHLKTLELTKYPPAAAKQANPAGATISAITERLEAFRSASEERSMWVEEGLARVFEGSHHPRWAGFILLAEVV